MTPTIKESSLQSSTFDKFYPTTSDLSKFEMLDKTVETLNLQERN